MLSCKEVSQLVSESLDRQLPLRQRLAVRLHLLMCKFCFRFREQMLFLRKAAREERSVSEAEEIPPSTTLSPEARQRIKRLLKDNSH